jgi:hypothetical protein
MEWRGYVQVERVDGEEFALLLLLLLLLLMIMMIVMDVM